MSHIRVKQIYQRDSSCYIFTLILILIFPMALLKALGCAIKWCIYNTNIIIWLRVYFHDPHSTSINNGERYSPIEKLGAPADSPALPIVLRMAFS